MTAIELIAVEGLPEIGSKADLAQELVDRTEIRPGDIVVVSQKVVSKSEGRVRTLSEVAPGPEAEALAAELGKTPALVELILAESSRVVRAEHGVLIVETRSGLVCANAGIDSSNAGGEGTVILLPEDPDRSARSLRAAVERASGVAPVAVVIADSFGRPWRVGQTDVAIGCAGLEPLDDWRGREDRDGRRLAGTAIAIADQVAGAADLVRDKASGIPVAVVRGLARHVRHEHGPGAKALSRAAHSDLFR